MTPTGCPKIKTCESDTTVIGFEIRDAENREIGISFFTWTEIVVEGPLPAYHSGSELPVGTMIFRAYAHATRDGETFGALQARPCFETVAERDAYIVKRIVDGRKRAERIADKPAREKRQALQGALGKRRFI